MQEISAEVREMTRKRGSATREGGDADQLRRRLKNIGLSDPAITAAWPTWWSDEAEDSLSARTELRFSLSRKLGLEPSSLLEDGVPRFVWQDVARFKHLSREGVIEQAAITSFGRAIANLLIGSTPAHGSLVGADPSNLRNLILRMRRPYVDLADLLSLCWSVGIPVIHLRVFPWPQKRMAAMVVRAANRYAILLGKDSQYPAHIAFYLAHEIGHVAAGHLEENRVIVDLESEDMNLDTVDGEEISADRFALDLLTGMPAPVILPSTQRYSALSLAKTVLGASTELAIEPGTLALCFGYSTKDWPTSTAAMRHIYPSPNRSGGK